MEELGIGAHGVQRDDQVTVEDIILAIVEGDDIGIVVVPQIFIVDLKDMFVITEEVAHLADLLAVGGGYATNPRGGLATLDIGELDVF